MLNLASPSAKSSSHGVFDKDSLPLQASQPPPTLNSSNPSRISPSLLFIIIILAVIVFMFGLLHLLLRFLVKKNPSSSSIHSDNNNQETQRQLQQLFHLHDSGLDQTLIDALPVFLYREIVGSKEPFDCPVCLCEFSQDDELRLLPICGHAFHIDCIDTWLLSNSTCPLCRGALFSQGTGIENPMFDIEVLSLEEMVHVRLGKFRNTSNIDENNLNGNSITNREVGESSSSNFDARRCYSMGSYQYVVGDVNLRVPLKVGDRNHERAKGVVVNDEGKRLGVGSKGESFSMSKIWLWGSNKGKFPVSSSASSFESCSIDGGLPWVMARRSEGNTT